MKLLFVNAFKTKNPFNWLVAIRSGGRYSHCEFIFRDDYMFGAAFLDGRCRFREYEPHPEDDVFETNISIREENLIRLQCQKYNGYPYDYTGLIGFVFKSDDFNHKKKYFCSELMSYILAKVTDYDPPKAHCRIHPVRLFKRLKSQKIIKE